MNIQGVGSDAPMVVNEQGGKQSLVLQRFDLLPPLACAEVASVLAAGCDKYGEWNWHKISAKEHLNHLMMHLFAFIAGDESEVDELEHARHAATRALFWLEMLVKEKENLAKLATKYKGVVYIKKDEWGWGAWADGCRCTLVTSDMTKERATCLGHGLARDKGYDIVIVEDNDPAKLATNETVSRNPGEVKVEYDHDCSRWEIFINGVFEDSWHTLEMARVKSEDLAKRLGFKLTIDEQV